MTSQQIINEIAGVSRREKAIIYDALTEQLALKGKSTPFGHYSPQRSVEHYRDVMLAVSGIDVLADSSRKALVVWARNIVAHRMLRDGFSVRDTAASIRKDHSTVSQVKRKIAWMLKHPVSYAKEIRLYEQFNAALKSRNEKS